MKYLKQLLIIFSQCFLLSTHVFSQDGDHLEQLAKLNFLLGDWKIDVETRLSAQGPWEKSQATSAIRKTLNSSLIEEDFTGQRQGKDFRSKTLFGVNNMNARYQRVFADSDHGVLIDFEGVRSKDSIYFDRLWSYPNGSTVKLRVLYLLGTSDEFVVVNLRMPQQQTEWDITGRMKYTRIK